MLGTQTQTHTHTNTHDFVAFCVVETYLRRNNRLFGCTIVVVGYFFFMSKNSIVVLRPCPAATLPSLHIRSVFRRLQSCKSRCIFCRSGMFCVFEFSRWLWNHFSKPFSKFIRQCLLWKSIHLLGFSYFHWTKKSDLALSCLISSTTENINHIISATIMHVMEMQREEWTI